MEYEDLTRKIIGCAMTVHSTLGNGFQEVIYQRAFGIEMTEQGLPFGREVEMEIFYRGYKTIKAILPAVQWQNWRARLSCATLDGE